MKRIAVFPGSFDPITLGHRSIVLRALPMFDIIYVAVGVNMEKRSTFPLENRIKWAKEVFADYPNVIVESYDGLTADFCTKVGARFIIRGLRSGSDFEYENMICHANKRLHPRLLRYGLWAGRGCHDAGWRRTVRRPPPRHRRQVP